MLSVVRPRVLCVDDDADSRMMLIALLKYESIQADAIANGELALSLMQFVHFDLFLLDAWLPGLDGFELCRRMRLLDPSTPILFFSGAAYETDRQRGIAAGATAYLAKPDIDGLIRSATQLLFHPPLAAMAAASIENLAIAV